MTLLQTDSLMSSHVQNVAPTQTAIPILYSNARSTRKISKQILKLPRQDSQNQICITLTYWWSLINRLTDAG